MGSVYHGFMALPAGPKLRNVNPLPEYFGDPVSWIEHATQQDLYPWQREAIEKLSVSNKNRPRVAYIQVPRKNGKTRLAACLALLEMCLGNQRHVYAIADSERNLNSVLIRELRDLIGGSEYLRDSVHIFKNHIEVPETGSFIETRPSNLQASQGINPHLVLFDEIHLQKTDQIWNGMQMAGAARDDALLFGITSPGYDLTSHAHNLYQSVKSGSDDDIFGIIYEMPSGIDISDRNGWKIGNPCWDRPRFKDAMEYDFTHLPEHEFRRFRLGQWTATESAWLPYGAWDTCADYGRDIPPPGAKIWLGFDGSYSGDSTALMGCTEDLHLFVVGCWENPGKTGWRVPRSDVIDTITFAMENYNVQELLCDPPYWGREIAEWDSFWPGKIVEFPTFNRSHMAPACTTFHAAVMDAKLTHDGDKRLARHISNCIIKQSPLGDYVTKADKNSPAKIDLAVAAIIAYSAAARHFKPQKSPVFVL